MDQYTHFNTSFVVNDSRLTEDFLNIAFIELKQEAKKIINGTGTFSITVTIEALETTEASSQALQLEEVA